MKILVVGDPHGRIDLLRKAPLKGVDLILVTGDLGKADFARNRFFENIKRKEKGLPELEYTSQDIKKAYMEVYVSSLKVVKYLSKFARVFLIFGNVEYHNDDVRKKIKECGAKLPFLVDDLNAINGVSIINNRIRNFNGVRIGGVEFFVDTNWVRDFKPRDYKESLKRAKKATHKAKRIMGNWGNVDVLLHHQPPYRILDKVGGHAPKHWHGKHAGSKVILEYIRKHKPRYAFCGHIMKLKVTKKSEEQMFIILELEDIR